jgi:plasmid stabilization system protein ParE
MFSVKVLPVALQDLKSAKSWYNKQRENLGKEFKSEVNREIEYISEFPEHYQIQFGEIRQSLVSRFPYAIFYFIDEDFNQIVIIGVLHTKRNPQIAKKRMK